MEIVNNVYIIEVYESQLWGKNFNVQEKLLVQLLDICPEAFNFNDELYSPVGYTAHEYVYYVKLLDCANDSPFIDLKGKTICFPHNRVKYDRKSYNSIDLGEYSDKLLTTWKVLYGNN